MTGARPALAQNGEGSGQGSELRLRPGDAVRLEVRDEPELAGEYLIDRDGQALLPIVGLVNVAGRSFEDVRREVREAYGRQVARAEVRLTPVLRIAVLGEVTRPGLVAADPTYTLADLIASAGGLSPSADRNAIHLVRAGAPVVTLPVEELATSRIQVLPGDQVQVDRRSWIQENLSIFVGYGASVLAALVTALVLR